MTGAAVAALPAVSYDSQRPSATLLSSRERENREGGTCAANTPNVCVFEFFVILRVAGGQFGKACSAVVEPLEMWTTTKTTKYGVGEFS